MALRERLARSAVPTVPLGATTSNPIHRIRADIRAELASDGRYPPGPSRFDPRLMQRMAHDPLPVLMKFYELHGPIFSMRLMHARVVFMIGPEANNFVTVTHPELFKWREGSLGDLIPLLGDGLLTIDDEYHDRARRIMVPAFHSAQIAAAVEAMTEETNQALELLPGGLVADVYAWSRRLAMRIAMRALLGLDPDDGGKGEAAAEDFESALGFYGVDYHLRILRGPGSAWNRMMKARGKLDQIVYAEIERRRRLEDPHGGDVMSLLLSARGEDGEAFTDREVRDQVMTLMFAGHDTSTSTLSFLFHELSRNPGIRERLQAELDDSLGGASPTPRQLSRELPYLDMVIDEVLRLYPPAWVGPRRSVSEFEFAGQHVPSGTHINYCSWATHRLPEVFSEPDVFDPEHFSPERRAAIPRGGYVPFGAGSRICIGKRFGLTEIKQVAAIVLQRVELDPDPGYELRIRQMPTLSPIGGLPMRVRRRDASPI